MLVIIKSTTIANIYELLASDKNSSKCLISSYNIHEDTYEGGTSIFYIFLVRKLSSRRVVNFPISLGCKWWSWDWNTAIWPTACGIVNCILMFSHLMLTILGTGYYYPPFIVPALHCCNTVQGLKSLVPIACQSWRNWSFSLMVCEWGMFTVLCTLKTVKHCWED